MRVAFRTLALAATLGACAPPTALAQQQPQAQAMLPASYSDAQLQAFARARTEIEPLVLAQFSAVDNADRDRAEARIADALRRNGLTRDDYDNIASAAMADKPLAERINQFAKAGAHGTH
jgi:hypothetical protein